MNLATIKGPKELLDTLVAEMIAGRATEKEIEAVASMIRDSWTGRGGRRYV